MDRREFVINLQIRGLIVAKRKEIPFNTVIGILSKIGKTNECGIMVLYTISSEIINENYDYLNVYKLLCKKYKL